MPIWLAKSINGISVIISWSAFLLVPIMIINNNSDNNIIMIIMIVIMITIPDIEKDRLSTIAIAFFA